MTVSTDPLVDQLTEAFLRVRAGAPPLAHVPEGCEVPSDDVAYRVQHATMHAMGDRIAGWKVGARTPDSEPFAAPILAATLFDGETVLPPGLCRLIGVEAEIAYRFGHGLPPRDAPYTTAEVCDAIVSVHTAIEIIDTRFATAGSQPALDHLADQQSHGALFVGPGITDWRSLVPVEERVILTVGDKVVDDHVGGNSAGDPIRTLVWLAAHAARYAGGLAAGTIVTTGSTTGTLFVEPGTRVSATFPHLGTLSLTCG
ncbi:putative 2-keto-4-pentenoate hydratase-like protein [Gluconacetobacter diazotrophicus PA1 5]|nr:fumarylacetoacetate hydrolase family protein [Gluconacetobacter diazotrophicus]ACI51671.1 putative 2-keto-4-pentenoate hydratase-like protein [Gluconacetobacter diazotrophicus PA1 5]TWB11015.1 2-keto-4-pentenoate hydratase [Gluconacetobacter diazotrophicus]